MSRKCWGRFQPCFLVFITAEGWQRPPGTVSLLLHSCSQHSLLYVRRNPYGHLLLLSTSHVSQITKYILMHFNNLLISSRGPPRRWNFVRSIGGRGIAKSVCLCISPQRVHSSVYDEQWQHPLNIVVCYESAYLVRADKKGPYECICCLFTLFLLCFLKLEKARISPQCSTRKRSLGCF